MELGAQTATMKHNVGSSDTTPTIVVTLEDKLVICTNPTHPRRPYHPFVNVQIDLLTATIKDFVCMFTILI
jgi:hypothetical protein